MHSYANRYILKTRKSLLPNRFMPRKRGLTLHISAPPEAPNVPLIGAAQSESARRRRGDKTTPPACSLTATPPSADHLHRRRPLIPPPRSFRFRPGAATGPAPPGTGSGVVIFAVLTGLCGFSLTVRGPLPRPAPGIDAFVFLRLSVRFA